MFDVATTPRVNLRFLRESVVDVVIDVILVTECIECVSSVGGHDVRRARRRGGLYTCNIV